jgi:hypothetical protein
MLFLRSIKILQDLVQTGYAHRELIVLLVQLYRCLVPRVLLIVIKVVQLKVLALRVHKDIFVIKKVYRSRQVCVLQVIVFAINQNIPSISYFISVPY